MTIYKFYKEKYNYIINDKNLSLNMKNSKIKRLDDWYNDIIYDKLVNWLFGDLLFFIIPCFFYFWLVCYENQTDFLINTLKYSGISIAVSIILCILDVHLFSFVKFKVDED